MHTSKANHYAGDAEQGSHESESTGLAEEFRGQVEELQGQVEALKGAIGGLPPAFPHELIIYLVGFYSVSLNRQDVVFRSCKDNVSFR